MESESRAVIPDKYGFWRCDGKYKRNLALLGNPGTYWKAHPEFMDCPHKDICWRAQDIETAWLVYSDICGEWNNYHWFYGDVLERR